jgi:hypothetical protein
MKKNKTKSVVIIIILSFLAFISNMRIFPSKSYNNSEQNSDILIQSTTPINSAIIDPVDLYGIVIGISDYFGSYDDKLYADTDAEAFYSILIDDYGCDPEKIFLLIDQSATKENIISLFDNISSFVDDNDKFILYFAGNGFVDDPLEQNFSIDIQTPHDYNSYENIYWNITHDNASAVRVHFSLFETEYNQDYLYLSQSDTVSGINFDKKISGNRGLNFWSDYIPTFNDSIHLRFTSTLSNHDYGFQIDKYQIINGSSQSQGICPSGYYQNQSNFINSSILNQKISEINCSKKYLFFDSDYSGGLLSNIIDENTFAMSSTNSNEFNILDNNLYSGCFSRYLFNSFDFSLVDTNFDGFNSYQEIFDYVNLSTIQRSAQIQHSIYPQIYNGNSNQNFIFPSIFNTSYSIIGNNLNYSFSIDGIFRTQDVNLITYSSSDNSYINITLNHSQISDSGFGYYSGSFSHNKSISSAGITSKIPTNLSQPTFIFSYQDTDFDSDNLTDIYEIIIGTNSGLNDTDFDTLYDKYELEIGTDPLNNDTDQDGMSDGWEYLYSLNPKNSDDNITDEDGDFLINIYEFQNGTSPINIDTDSDNMEDLYEVIYNLNPLDPSDNITDPDNDGMLSIWEASNNTWTDPFNPDCDSDGLNDFWEWGNRTDPWDNDTDSDGLFDGEELLNYSTNPLVQDTDYDGLFDGIEVHTTLTSPILNDTDGDGLLDGLEINIGTNANNPDTDGDGINDFEEIYEGDDGYITNPNNKDTDGDGQDDLFEIRGGTDPTDPNSKSELWWQLPLVFGSIGGIIVFSVIYKKSKVWRFNRILKLSKKKSK